MADLTTQQLFDFIAPLEDASGTARFEVHDDAAGNPTIGIGHLITPAERKALQVGSIKLRDQNGKLSVASKPTDQQLMELFESDVSKAQTLAKKHFPNGNVNQMTALTSFFFNVGEVLFS